MTLKSNAGSSYVKNYLENLTKITMGEIPFIGRFINAMNSTNGEIAIKNKFKGVFDKYSELFDYIVQDENDIKRIQKSIDEFISDKYHKEEYEGILVTILNKIPTAWTLQRQKYLAAAMAHSVNPKDFNYSQYSMLLSTLSITPDIDILFLNAFRNYLKENKKSNAQDSSIPYNRISKIKLQTIDENNLVNNYKIVDSCSGLGLVQKLLVPAKNYSSDSYYVVNMTSLGYDLLDYIIVSKNN